MALGGRERLGKSRERRAIRRLSLLTPNGSLLSPPPSVPRVLHVTPLVVLSAMILLDGLDKHDQQSPKLVAEASSSFHPITRVQTPTPSLPDYEASQAQLRPTSQFLQLQIEPQDRLRPTTQSYSDINEKRTRRRRCRKWTLYVLTTYFLLTVVIGIPIIVVVSSSFILLL